MRPRTSPAPVCDYHLARQDAFAGQLDTDDPFALDPQVIDGGPFAHDRTEVGGGPCQRLRKGERQQLVFVSVVDRASNGGIPGRFGDLDGGRVQPRHDRPSIRFPGALRTQRALVALAEGDLKPSRGAVADIRARPIAELVGEGRKQPSALLGKRGEGRCGIAPMMPLDHAGGGPGRLATHLPALEDHHFQPGLRELVGDRRADRSGADDDDVRAHTPDLNPRSTVSRLVDQAPQPQVFARARFLVKGAGRHLAQAGRRRPLDDPVEAVDLAVDVAIGLKDLEKGGPLTQDLLEIRTVHRWER